MATIMIVEDEQAIALLLKYNLEKNGYETIIVSHGNRVVTAVENICRRWFCWTGCCRKCRGWSFVRLSAIIRS